MLGLIIDNISYAFTTLSTSIKHIFSIQCMKNNTAGPPLDITDISEHNKILLHKEN